MHKYNNDFSDVQKGEITLTGAKLEVVQTKSEIEKILQNMVHQKTADLVKQVQGDDAYLIYLNAEEVRIFHALFHVSLLFDTLIKVLLIAVN